MMLFDEGNPAIPIRLSLPDRIVLDTLEMIAFELPLMIIDESLDPSILLLSPVTIAESIPSARL
jgi:hypothetical protein